eukprot:4714339-Ditylum_brightwellii.AAC.1
MKTEDANHFLLCNQNIEKWESLVENLKETYEKDHTNPCIRILVNRALKNLPMEKTKEEHKGIDWTPYQSLMKQQTAIGWEKIKCGRFETEWSKNQRKYSATIHKKAGLINTGWEEYYNKSGITPN